MKIMTVRVPDNLQNKLMKYAKHNGITRNGLILHILWEWAREHGIEI